MPYLYTAKDKEYQRKRNIRRHHLPEEQVNNMLADQNGCCAICSEPILNFFVIDHNNKCCSQIYSCGKCVRALVCRQCNAGLGMFSDSPDVFRKAITYLEHHQSEAQRAALLERSEHA